MAVQNPPFAIQALSHSAELFRRAAIGHDLNAGGVIGISDLLVTANGTPNMTVNVAAGEAAVLGTESTRQGPYYALNDATVNLTIAAADPTNPRRDLVVLKVQDAQYSGATNAASLVVVTGTPAGAPVDPVVPANAVVLARVAVAANAASIVAGNITDLRPFVSMGVADAINDQGWAAASASRAVGARRNQDGTYTAKNAIAAIQESFNGVVNFYSDSGLTPGNSFTPTKRTTINADGSFQALGLDHFIGPYAYGGGVGVSRLHVTAQPSYVGIGAEGDGANRDMSLQTKGTGTYSFQPGGGTAVAQILSTGQVQAVGDALFGPYALGSGVGVSRLHAFFSSTAAFLAAEGDGANRDLIFRQKGTGQFYFQTAAGGDLGRINQLGNILGIAIASFGAGAFGAASGYGQVGDDGAGNALVQANHGTLANAGLYFQLKGTGIFAWRDGGATQIAGMSNVGAFQAKGQSNTLGLGVFGAAQAFTSIGDDAGGNALLFAGHGTLANAGLIFRAKGTGNLRFQSPGGLDLLQIDPNGHLLGPSGTGTPGVSGLHGSLTSGVAAGDDTVGTVTLTGNTAASIAAGTKVCTVTFAHAYGSAPRAVLLMPKNGNAHLSTVVAETIGTASFDIFVGAGSGLAIPNAATFLIEYLVIA